MTVTAPDQRALVGSVVPLDARRPADVDALFAALDDPRVWESGYGGGPAGRPADRAALQSKLDTPGSGDGGPLRAQYVVRRVADQRVVRTSTLGDIDLANARGHVGWTAYHPDVWGSVVNPECKLLLLGHAFEDCGLERLKLQTDADLNARSQAAIVKLGAQFEGILRHHVRRADGSWRDTAVFSILRAEWPAVREALLRRIHG